MNERSWHELRLYSLPQLTQIIEKSTPSSIREYSQMLLLKSVVGLRRVRMKKNSAVINEQLLINNSQKNQIECQREIVMKMLATQLKKKVFFSALRYNHSLIIYKRNQNAGKPVQKVSIDVQCDILINEQRQQQQQEQQKQEEQQKQQDNSARTLIFVQTLAALFKKHQYYTFTSLQRGLPKAVPQQVKQYQETVKQYFIEWRNKAILQPTSSYSKTSIKQAPKPQSQAILQSKERTIDIQLDNVMVMKTQSLHKRIFQPKVRYFLSRLTDKCAVQRIKTTCDEIYLQNFIRKQFMLLIQKCRASKIQRQRYYEHVVDEQVEELEVARLFSKTSLLCTYFNRLKANRRDNVAARILLKCVMNQGFNNIRRSAIGARKKQQTLQRREQGRKKILKFRVFRYFKLMSGYNSQSAAILRDHLQSKNRYRKQIFLSSLSLLWKQQRIKRAKAQTLYANTLQLKCFAALELLRNKKVQFCRHEQQLTNYIHAAQVVHFKKLLLDWHRSMLSRQRMEVKKQRVKDMKIRNEAQRRLRSWLGAYLTQRIHRSIVLRMTAMRQKESKKQILQIWRRRLFQLNEQDKKEGSNHKQWLKKYYGDLCSLIDY